MGEHSGWWSADSRGSDLASNAHSWVSILMVRPVAAG